MYYVKLRHNSNGHESNWCTDNNLEAAKEKAKADYLRRYFNTELPDTTYLKRDTAPEQMLANLEEPVEASSDQVEYPVVTLLDQMVSTFQKMERRGYLASSGNAETEDKEADDLFAMVQAAKEAPGSTTIAVVDPKVSTTSDGKISQDALGIYNDMLTLSSLANVASMKKLYKKHPLPYDITDPKEASEFIRQQVIWLNETFTKDLGTYALPGDTARSEFNKEVWAAELHTEILGSLFSSFGFPATALLKLDAIMTNVKQTLEKLKVGVEDEGKSVDHMIFVNFIEAVSIEGVSEKILTGKIRLFHIKIDSSSWKASIGRKATASKVKFAMSYYDTVLQMNSSLIRTDIANIQGLIKKFTNASFEEVSKLTSPKTVTT